MAKRREGTMHEMVANTLRERIAFGHYPENELLPPEMMLAAELSVSRHTVREAMKTLEAEGMINRRPGRGTVIVPRSEVSEKWGIRSIDDLYGEFEYHNTNVLKRGMVPAKAHPHAAQIFGAKPTASLYQIERVLNRQSQPAALNRLYTLVRYASKIPEERLGGEPLIRMVDEYNRISPFRMRQVATAELADDHVARHLDIAPGAAVLVLERTYISQQGSPLVHTKLICRPDRYQQTVDFFREDDAATAAD